MMRALLLAVLVWAGCLCAAQAAEGEFDRTAEIAELKALMQTADRRTATMVAGRIYWSGIADPGLAAVVNERLLKDYQTLSPKERIGGGHAHIAVDDHYGRWMVRALGSFGLKEFEATLAEVARTQRNGGSPLRRVRSEAEYVAEQIGWHAEKNRIMASTANHAAGDDERVSRLMNLLLSEVPEYQVFAMERIADGQLQDQRLYTTLSEQLAAVTGGTPLSEPALRAKILSIKILLRAQDSQYLPLFEKLAAANVDQQLKRHAQAAIERIQRGNAAKDAAEQSSEDEDA